MCVKCQHVVAQGCQHLDNSQTCYVLVLDVLQKARAQVNRRERQPSSQSTHMYPRSAVEQQQRWHRRIAVDNAFEDTSVKLVTYGDMS